MKIFAHRGASSYAPENTLAAFQKALEMNVDGIELDVQLSKDGVPVVCHDFTINRTSNGKGYIHDLTLAQLKSYRFYGKFKNEFPNEQIPTLEEVLQLIGNHDITLNIELKHGPFKHSNLEEKVISLVKKYNIEQGVIYSSFDHQSVERIARLAPDARLALIFHINLINVFDYVARTGLNIYSIHPNYIYVTKELLAEAKKHQIKVFSYTINDKARAQHYQALKMDGIITNNPLLLK